MSVLPFHHRPLPVTGMPCLIVMVGDCVRAGFPSRAEDFAAKRIDLTAELIAHPQATFMIRVSRQSMIEAGIADGNVMVAIVYRQLLGCTTRIYGAGMPWDIGRPPGLSRGSRPTSAIAEGSIRCSPHGRQSTRVVEALTRIAFGG